MAENFFAPNEPTFSRFLALLGPNPLIYSAFAYLRPFAGVSVRRMTMSDFKYSLTN